ncbi:MAG: acyltransferase family protein [Acidimicrobiia bacterium]|nr:acyltransferase family protein [Acidimicrobiia bacterium]
MTSTTTRSRNHRRPSRPGSKPDVAGNRDTVAAGARRRERSSGDLIDRIGVHVDRAAADPTSRWDPDYVARTLRIMDRFNRYFASEVVGWEKVPTDRPVLFVGNHSGGQLSPDTCALLSKWYETRGFEHPLALLAFDLLLAIPGMGDLVRKIGGVPAGHDTAERALESGASVVVYPGGDHEVFRPFWHRNHIDFDGRKGFVKLAIRTGVPIVPVVGHGGHETMVVVARGEGLARRLRLDRVRVKILPFALGGPLGVMPGFLPAVPIPAKITLQVLDPIDLSHIDPAAADDPEILQACYDDVTERMQSALTAMAKDRPFPVLSRLAELVERG